MHINSENPRSERLLTSYANPFFVWMRFVIDGVEKLLYLHILNDIFGFRLGRGPLPSANFLCILDKAEKLQDQRKVKKIHKIKSVSRDKFCRKHVLE